MEKVENTEEVKATETVETPTAEQQAQQEQRNVLLGTISYTNPEDYEKFLDGLDVNQAIFVLIASANYGQAKGLYNLDEAELVTKAIKTIKKNSQPVTTETPGSTTETE